MLWSGSGRRGSLPCFGRGRKKEPALRLPIYTYGPIVHNERIVEELEERGVRVLKSLKELTELAEGIVVIRAHGVGKEIYETLEQRGLKIVDSSCPFVRKIQKLVAEHTKNGESVIVMGDPEHPEVQGILGWGEGDVIALKGVEEVEALPDGNGKNVFIVAQTTFHIDKFKVVLETFKKRVIILLLSIRFATQLSNVSQKQGN